MALNLLTNPASTPTVSSDWTNLVAREDAAGIGVGTGIRTFSLTNVGTTTKPAVAIGSIIEVGGSIYQADSDTALTDDTGLVDGTVHIKLVPSGTTVIPTLTNDSIPAWDSEKGGWYDVDDKFLPFEMTKASSAYSNKCEYVNQNKTVKVCDDGSAYLDGSITAEGVFSPQVTPTNAVKLSGNLIQGDVFTAVSPMIPNVGDTCLVSGSSVRSGITSSSTASLFIYSYATRTSSTNIKFYLSNLSMFFNSGAYTGSSNITASTDAESGSTDDFISGYSTDIAIGTIIP